VVSGKTHIVVGPTSADEFTLPAMQGNGYLVEPVAAPTTALPYAPVTGTPATAYRTLGAAQIGLPAAG
jgi:hypothetical protein